MFIDVTSYLNSTEDRTVEEPSSDLDKDAFLSLFVAQLENQDPLDPVQDTESVAQLAQFTSLEQLTNISGYVEELTEAITSQGDASAISYLGTQVLAEGNSIALEEGVATDVAYYLSEDAYDVAANIYDEDGYIVSSILLGDLNNGSYEYSWDGTDTYGNEVPDGTYSISFAGTDANGDSVEIITLIEGTVTGFAFSGDDVVFSLDDNRSVNMSDVYEVVQAEETTTETETEE